MKNANIQLETLTCPSCMQKIESALKSLDGVEKDSVNVMFNASKVKLAFNETQLSLEDINKTITKLGYEITKSSARTPCKK